jgi:energy-converting hydrogenase Eha subunit C
MEAILAISLPIIISLGAFVMIVLIRRFDHQERLALIERGMDPAAFKNSAAQKTNPAGTLRFALLAIGVGVGILAGFMLGEATAIARGTAITSMIFIFGGIGLLISYLIHIKQEKEEKQQLYK